MLFAVSESPIPLEPSPEVPHPAGVGASRLLLGVKILVVDDDVDTRDLMCMMFDGTGAAVTAAGSAAEALDNIGGERPDVIVCDVGMPDEDGYSFMRKVRALGGQGASDAGAMRAIALTGYSRPEDRRTALEAGFDLHMPKPFDADRLLAAVAELARAAANR